MPLLLFLSALEEFEEAERKRKRKLKRKNKRKLRKVV